MNTKKYNFKIKNKPIGINFPTYFIADIAANHDGNLDKAIELINLAKESGADAVKFQHFTAETIVSKKTFDLMNSNLSHQKSWKKSVFDVYDEASLNFDWTKKLKKECDKLKIHFFTAPYSLDLINKVNKYICAYKVGSGDITWLEAIQEMAKKKKPLILATGASSLKDVKKAYSSIKRINKQICIMQCNTNYTAADDNFKYINLNVLKTYKKIFPNIVLGLSDHTPGHATVLGAVTLGARMVEKHFTKSNKLNGPDHKFSMTPKSWTEMVERCRELEDSLGDGIKKVEKNENETVIVQRRGAHLNKNKLKNQRLEKKDIIFLRPALKGSIFPNQLKKIKNKKFLKSKKNGDIVLWKDLK
jgi:N-acetylneuraminate synthase